MSSSHRTGTLTSILSIEVTASAAIMSQCLGTPVSRDTLNLSRPRSKTRHLWLSITRDILWWLSWKNDPLTNKKPQKAQRELEETKETPHLGHVMLSPPINVNVYNEGYTEDWAVIEVDTSKVD
ncbi:hypothetical protein K435DRAFT_869850 [Dendrothele bispora CBS 962.96]|uniref:Uncharacterized protein n=1 Tax=Dendrothele bispora (strain CBS 962.96) TaxID=1314807 RepID=A0A4S8L832_DENBC|nr:hypothetical protein K435DRAFT_869850 [Dendrothele bispora CBS 962.96]